AAGQGGGQAPASGVAGKSGLRLREPTVQADARLNAIIVQDIPDRIPIYRSLIEQLDLPSTLVEIEAMIVDVNSDLVSELGVTWGARAGSTTFGYGNLGLGPSGGLPLESGAALSPGTIGVSVGNTLAARLRALQTKGQANILSQPSILTADNLGAMIDLSDTFYIQTRGERVATVTPVTVGTSLRVTPRHIESKNGARVELTVDIEDGRIQEERQIDNLPTVRKSNISTLAIVGNDQTLLIGGYNSSQNSEQVDKVPILGDIPGLGLLFSNKSKTVQRRERLFLIRPKVVAINGEVVATPGAAGTGPMLNATWGGDRMTPGQYLDLAQSQRTRIVFGPNVELRRSSGPVRASEWLDGTPTAAPVLEGKSNAQQGPVIQVEPVAAPGTGRAP
ncbi:type III secretion system outer membrane ring subunit SctC, partial [Achromobacter insuavis]|uniref:type III secretion system outer membrane ring subunit SctC n=2 Tax=Alcaligenaceae TaxID=506 RepID=UPI0015D331BF